jgi:hypothetical protein
MSLDHATVIYVDDVDDYGDDFTLPYRECDLISPQNDDDDEEE